MKKIIVALTLCVSVAVFAQKSDAPAVAKAAFAKAYPAATKVKWEKEGKTYEVALNYNGQNITVSLDGKGTIVETEFGIKSIDLPAPALKYVSDNFKLVGLVDMIQGQKSKYIWGEQVNNYQLKKGFNIYIYERNN